jgi:K+-transporting ATPase KdpF subunit
MNLSFNLRKNDFVHHVFGITFRYKYYIDMKTNSAKSIMALVVVPIQSDAVVSNGPISYIIGGIIALLILGYLVYTLLRPDKF